MAVLAAATQAGSTTLTLTGPTAPAQVFVIGRDLPEAEIHRSTSVVGKTVTLERPLTSDKPAKCIVQPFDGGLVPWTWWGARGSGAEADATLNTLAFNRLSQQICDAGVVGIAGGIFIPSGTFFVDDELWIETGQTLAGVSPDVSLIRAAPSFPFTDTGEVAILHGKRLGLPTMYSVPGASSRWFLRDFYIGGQSITNSCGILISPQQPESIINIRVDRCLGLYGLCLTDVQDTKMSNVQFIGNYCALRYRGAELVRCWGLNIEQMKGPSAVIAEGIPGGIQSMWNSFDGVHLEHDQELVAFDFREGASGIGISNLFYSNPQSGTCIKFDTPLANPGGAARYFLSNIWCNAPSNDYKMVEDVQRGKSLNSFSDTDRWIDFLTPERLMAWTGPKA